MGVDLPAGLLLSTFTVLAPTRTPSAAGGWTTTFASIGTVSGELTIRASAMHGFAAMEGGGEKDIEIVDFTLDDPAPYLISGKCRIEDEDGTQYEIVSFRRQPPLVLAMGRAV